MAAPFFLCCEGCSLKHISSATPQAVSSSGEPKQREERTEGGPGHVRSSLACGPYAAKSQDTNALVLVGLRAYSSFKWKELGLSSEFG